MGIFSRLKTELTLLHKRYEASKERLDLSRHARVDGARIITKPFRHMVIDDFFTEEAFSLLEKHVRSVLDQGFGEAGDVKRFAPFPESEGRSYDGYLYMPDARLSGAPAFLYSQSWNLLFSSLFNIPTGPCTVVAYHHHLVGDRAGFPHNDFTTEAFSEQDRLANGIIWRSRKGDDSFLRRRAITLIIYLDDKGGGTRLYQKGETAPLCVIAARRNRLLAFEVSPISQHAFEGTDAPRTSITQWFHTDFA